MGREKEISPLFVAATRDYVDSLVRVREGEQKLGERVQIASMERLQECTAKYVLLGIPEDIGVRANFGIGGAHTLWEPALRSIFNLQHNEYCDGRTLLVLGSFDFTGWMQASKTMNADRMRALVDYIDEAVYPVIERIVAAGKIPVVIGGGHNNAYPLLQGASYAKGVAINCINLDAHSDYRSIEGRHSGNGFRYARRDGFLDKYAMIGLHRAYNSEAVMTVIEEEVELQASFYEDIFLEERLSFKQAVLNALEHTSGKPVGIELDLDSVERTLSSAATPVGLTPLHARQYLHLCMKSAAVAYVHICEGAVQLRDSREDNSTAKLVAYLVSDILAANNQ